jgi:hypothetical protein
MKVIVFFEKKVLGAFPRHESCVAVVQSRIPTSFKFCFWLARKCTLSASARQKEQR